MGTTEGDGKSMWQQLGGMIGGIFGGRLSAEEQVQVEVLFGLIGFLAKADGLITSYESEFANQMMDNLKLSLGGREKALNAFNSGRTTGYDVEAEVKRFSALHPSGSEEMERLFEALLRLSLSDGRMYRRERDALERVATAFGLTNDALEARLRALKVE